MAQTIVGASTCNLPGLFSLAIASVIVFAAAAEFAVDKAGIEPASHPMSLGFLLVVMVGFPLGVLALSHPSKAPLPGVLRRSRWSDGFPKDRGSRSTASLPVPTVTTKSLNLCIGQIARSISIASILRLCFFLPGRRNWSRTAPRMGFGG